MVPSSATLARLYVRGGTIDLEGDAGYVRRWVFGYRLAAARGPDRVDRGRGMTCL